MKNFHLRVTNIKDFNEKDFARYKTIMAKIMASEGALDELEKFGIYVERDSENDIETIYELDVTEIGEDDAVQS